MVLLSARIRIIHSLLCCFTMMSLNAAELIKGDEQASGTTFSFPVNKAVRDPNDDALFIGAQQAGAGVFALSGLNAASQQAQPLAPEIITLNNEVEQPNPLFSQGIALLDLMETTDSRRTPIMVSTSDLTRVYLMREFNRFDHISMFATNPLLDATMQVTQGIVGIVGFRGGFRSAALAAVTPHSTGIFGDTGSGFTSLAYDQVNQQVPGVDGAAPTIRNVFYFSQVSGTAFDRSSTAIAINGAVTSLTQNLAMHWNRIIQEGYVGFQLVGGPNGARSLMITDVNNAGVITLRQFAPDSAFDNAGNQIIGGLGASINLSIQSVAGMETSTGLSYLIVQGGNGTPSETSNSVYALPVINARNKYGAVVDSAHQGVLASVNAQVYTFYDGNNPSRFIRRRFIEPAVLPVDTPRATDAAAQVGGGPIALGTIQALSVMYDAVIVSVSEVVGYNEPCRTGMFISRSIFDDAGKIKAWTPWERMGGVAEPVFHTEISIESGNITYLTGNTPSSINSVYRTAWGLGSEPGLNEYALQINSLYPNTNGGVQGLVDVPFGTPGLNGISMLIAGGNASVTLTEVGAQNYTGDQQCPHTSGYADNATVFQDGIISGPISSSALMLTIQGGALNDVGPITSSVIGVNSMMNQGYLFVGGSRGLAVLTKPDGSGWSTVNGLGPNFSGLTEGMAFTTLGNYSFVRKLIVDGKFLYVVTAKKVDRIDLSTSPAFTATTVASSISLVFDKNDTILDGVVSGKFGLLATTKGMFRISNDNDISLITIDDNKYWSLVPVPNGVVPPQQFLVSSTTGRETDVARDNGGMIQLLSAYLGSNRARVNRFSVKDVSYTLIDDTTILPLSDVEIEGFNSSFITFSGFRSTFTSDGALSLHTMGRTLLVSPYIKTRGFRTGPEIRLGDGNGTLIGQVLRSSTSGSWLVAGDFGIRINE